MPYAVAIGRKIGVFGTWKECSEHTKGYPNAKFKKFRTADDAKRFIEAAKSNIYTPATPTTPATPDYYVYTDGACTRNGRSNARAGIGVYFGESDARNVSRPVVDGRQTNNVAELEAIRTALELVRPDLQAGKRIVVVTDSQYAMRCVTDYGDACAAAGWTTPIPNQELVQRTYALFRECLPHVSIMHVKAHTGGDDSHSIGNMHADRLASQASSYSGTTNAAVAASPARQYLNVPYTKKDEAKRMGARWDKTKKRWYVMETHPSASNLTEQYT